MMNRGTLVGLLVLIVGAGGCRGKPGLGPADNYDTSSTWTRRPSVAMPGDVEQVAPSASPCRTVTGEALPARQAILTTTGAAPRPIPTSLTITRTRLYADFKLRCGSVACHGVRDEQISTPNPLARSPERFTVSEATFHLRPDLGTASHARIMSADPNLVMPPDGADGSKRAADDPIRLLGERLLAWEEAGFPASFTVSTADPGQAQQPLPGMPYQLNPELGASLTNIGSCLPLMAELPSVADEMAQRDALFARAQTFEDLPATLAETDLVSLDSASLAQRRTFSYAPTYTLFSDHAAKMRYVRVPMGKKIRFNPAINDFDIPPNTRFYKTFLRKVIDRNGQVGYRKIETRLIVSRPDERLPDGSYAVRSLMVVYAWDKDETMARKVTDPTRDQAPWSDRICPYVTDERTPRDPSQNPISSQIALSTCTYMSEEEIADPASGHIRHYAIPGKERCIQCHMGSTNHSFILGFTPYHVDRRPEGQGGIYELPSKDELDQLQRLLDYGVIEGIAPGQLKLEESQAPRKPRNDYELVAQGYMMGNCAFCHNPTGFPTVENPSLAEFDLFPSATGGAFEFSLERYSERVKAGPEQKLRYPYITPWMRDFTGADTGGPFTSDTKLLSLGNPKENPWPVLDWQRFVGRDGRIGTAVLSDPVDIQLLRVEWFGDSNALSFRLAGPWRSLIWRNVSTPFTYVETGESSIFIHMPRHVPGFDCRAPRIMAEWMLSIPSGPKLSGRHPAWPLGERGFRPDTDAENGFEQPYMEIKPGETPYRGRALCGSPEENRCLPVGIPTDTFGYEDAVAQAELRVRVFRASLVGQHCPEDLDILDPTVVLSNGRKKAPSDEGRYNGPRANPKAIVKDMVPDRAHFFSVDTTEPPGPWVPKRREWKAILVDRDPAVALKPQLAATVEQLSHYYLSRESRAFYTELLPLGLWSQKCTDSEEARKSPTLGELRRAQAAESPTLGDPRLAGMARMPWIFARDEKGALVPSELEESRRVHSQSRGEAIFRAICLNCHGRDVDSRSPLASTIAELTGGETIVANLRDGILGPTAAAGAHAEAVFSRAGRGGTSEDWKVRYLLFMGLGGTLSEIPAAAVQMVSRVPFYGALGVAREASQVADGNMLESARLLCVSVLRSELEVQRYKVQPSMGADRQAAAVLTLQPRGLHNTVFARGNGHYDLWESVCSFENEPTISVLRPDNFGLNPVAGNYRYFKSRKLFRARDAGGNPTYPADHPVGTRWGRVERGISADNTLPWCVIFDNETERAQAVSNFRDLGITSEADMPFCPPSLLARAFGRYVHDVNVDSAAQSLDPGFVDRWARRGAMNAGTAAYYFMDGVVRGTMKPQPAFDECPQGATASR